MDRNRRKIEGDAIGVEKMKIVYLDGKKGRKPQKTPQEANRGREGLHFIVVARGIIEIRLLPRATDGENGTGSVRVQDYLDPIMFG